MYGLRKVSIKKKRFFSLLESAFVKRSSHKSFHTVAEAYKKDQALYPLVLILEQQACTYHLISIVFLAHILLQSHKYKVAHDHEVLYKV